MSIQVGDSIPDVVLKIFGPEGMKDIHTKDIFKGKKVVLIGVPGAFTPTCAQRHVPDYIRHAKEIKEKGVDEIVCMAVNDPFVMNHWERVSGAGDKIMFLPDGNAAFTKELGLEMDGSGAGLGTRCKRFMMVVEQGIVKALEIEDNPGELEASAAGICLTKL